MGRSTTTAGRVPRTAAPSSSVSDWARRPVDSKRTDHRRCPGATFSLGRSYPHVRLCERIRSVVQSSIEHMFDKSRASTLIDAIGEASRAESAAIARRLAAVGELDAIRAVELAECKLWRTDPFEEVVAEIS